MPNAILLSGGVDSSALAYWKRPEHAITIDYGQAPAETEIAVSRRITSELKITHHLIRTDTRALGTGPLADSAQLPCAPTPEWWPFRNQFLVTVAAMAAIRIGVTEIMVGSVKSDTGHSDSTPEFIDLLNRLVHLQEGSIRVSAPAHSLTAVELVKESRIPFPLLAWTHSCHTGNLACGSCRGCIKQMEVMESIARGIHETG